MAPGVPLTRIYFKYPVFGQKAMDVQEAIATINASTQGAGVATVGGRMIVVTQAKDGLARSVAVDNIAGYEDRTVVTNPDQP